MGSADEQHPAERRGDDPDGAGLQLSERNGNLKRDVEFFRQDEEQNELLRTCENLKNHRVEIAAFFASHPDDKECGNFLKGFFNNTFIEQILSNGQWVGYRAYDDLFHMWRGSYLSREREVYYRWSSIASRINGMIVLNAWLAPDEMPLPTVEQQQEMILEAHAKDGTGFVLPQAAIDFVITGGNHYRDGKLRIYEFFRQGKTTKENIAFLKDAYGNGSTTNAIPGSGLWEQHDAKGIEISRYSSDESHRAQILLKWPMVEKRIRELIAADRYLSPKEKAEYPNKRIRSVRKVDARAKLPTHHYLGTSCGLELPSVVLTEQLRTLDKQCLGKHVGALNQTHLRSVNHALAISVGLIEPKPKAMCVCLCSTCANNFYGTGDYYLRRVNPYESQKGVCTYCNQRLGFEYMVATRRKGR